MEEKTNKKNNINPIVGAILIAGILIAGAILLKDTSLNDKKVNKNEETNYKEIEIKPIDENEHILGNKNAKIKIVEYSDTECPFCRIFHSTMHKIIEDNNGEVAWVYRHFPIAELHSNAFLEAVASECAWEQGGNDTFWKYIDGIYAKTESKNNFTEEKLKELAKELGLNLESFNECLSTQKYAGKVQKDMDEGQSAGVRGTPSNFIVKNGKVVESVGGAASYESMTQKINSLLK